MESESHGSRVHALDYPDIAANSYNSYTPSHRPGALARVHPQQGVVQYPLHSPNKIDLEGKPSKMHSVIQGVAVAVGNVKMKRIGKIHMGKG